MLSRILLFFVVAYLFFYFLGLFFSWRQRRKTVADKDYRTPADEMVLDPQCQSYLPRGSAITRGGHHFCSENCARAFLSR